MTGSNLARKLIASHLVSGEMAPGEEIALRVDQTLMGAELGATTSVFPADERVREFLRAEGREEAFVELAADRNADYDVTEEIDLSALEPLIAEPGSPGNVVPVREAAGASVHQVVVGSSANPGLRDFTIVAEVLRGRHTHPQVSLDVNPTSREILADLTRSGATLALIRAGARLHQTGCLGCIGMGQAPAIGRNSLRTFPRNFPGRSGTRDDAVWLCSPETAVAAALTGQITDPRDLGIPYPKLDLPTTCSIEAAVLEPPLPPDESRNIELAKAESIGTLPELDPLPDTLRLPVALKVGDNVSTDEILPAGAKALPFRSDIVKLADFAFTRLDETYPERVRDLGDHAVIGGDNYGQGSSREHAALVPRYLGLRLVIARSYARIHAANLVNFGVLPLEFADPADYEDVQAGDELLLDGVGEALEHGEVTVRNTTRDAAYKLRHSLSPRQIATIKAGGRIAQRNAA